MPNTGNWGIEVAVQNLGQTRRVLNQVEPAVGRALTVSLAAAAGKVATRARSLTPVSLAGGKGAGSARAAITVKRGGDVRSRFGFRVVQPDKGGSIIEWAGNKTSGNTEHGQKLIATLNERYGATPRFMWRAWDETKDEVLRDVGTAIAIAEDAISAKLK